MLTTAEQIKIKVINERLKSLILSSVDIKVDLKTGDFWAYDPKNKVLVYPVEGKNGIRILPANVFIGILFHEIGHAKYSNGLQDRHTFPDPKMAYGLLLNSLEDLRVEHKLMKVYPGTQDNLAATFDYTDKFYTEEQLLKFPPHINALLNIIRKKWGREVYYTDAQVQNFVERVASKFPEVLKFNSSKNLSEYIQQNFWEEYLTILKQDEQEEQKKQEKEEQGGQGEKGEQGEQGEADLGNSQSKPSQGQPNYQNISNLSEIDISQINKVEPEENKIPENLLETLSIARQNLEDIQEITKSEEYEKIEKYLHYSEKKTYEEMYTNIKPYLNYFTKKLNSILADNNLKRFGGAFSSGRLNTKILYKYKCHNNRLFSKPIIRAHKKYNVCLLVDESGSMAGDKIRESTKAIILLSEVLNKLKIPFEITGFNVAQRIYKTYSGTYTWKVKRNLESILGQVHASGSSNTCDAFAINCSMARLNKQEGENILIVLSDGQPSPRSDTIPLKDIKRLKGKFNYYYDFKLPIEIKKASKNATVIGIGLGYGGRYVEETYPEHVICEDATLLPKLLLKIIQKEIKRG